MHTNSLPWKTLPSFHPLTTVSPVTLDTQCPDASLSTVAWHHPGTATVERKTFPLHFLSLCLTEDKKWLVEELLKRGNHQGSSPFAPNPGWNEGRKSKSGIEKARHGELHLSKNELVDLISFPLRHCLLPGSFIWVSTGEVRTEARAGIRYEIIIGDEGGYLSSRKDKALSTAAPERTIFRNATWRDIHTRGLPDRKQLSDILLNVLCMAFCIPLAQWEAQINKKKHGWSRLLGVSPQPPQIQPTLTQQQSSSWIPTNCQVFRTQARIVSEWEIIRLLVTLYVSTQAVIMCCRGCCHVF